ncbi:hypothetical protein NLJ89_g3821 [Agrocybe chaxingu]|uniref:Golgi apparatus membrane protein TVP38 n=1 Tax=Agrocybe chaxingu TaxID=84603 RepID=A0A9W8MY46_9AGAR|nr:hypothetical protein NLJ89_g3821 [Agrocybe chaxingu]
MSAQSPPGFFAMIKKYSRYTFNRYRALHIFGKLFIWLVILFYICMGAFIVVVTPARIAQYLYDKARILASTRLGERLRVWSSKNEKWQALESVVVGRRVAASLSLMLIGITKTAKGLPLIILIRISPFPPWVYSNSLFASIEAVKLWQFVVATTFVFPKLLLHTFIGSKIAELSDGDQRGHMDTRTKVLNGVFVGGGILVAIFTSWTVYNLVQRHIRHLEGFSPEVDELAAEAIEDYDEEAPLLSPTHN